MLDIHDEFSFQLAISNRSGLVRLFDYDEFKDFMPISRRGFGKVKRAYSHILGHFVALKQLYDDDGFRVDFVREVNVQFYINQYFVM